MLKHSLKIVLGIILVFIGIIGGLIPIFQGWVFGVQGLIILAEYFPPLKKIPTFVYFHTHLHSAFFYWLSEDVKFAPVTFGSRPDSY